MKVLAEKYPTAQKRGKRLETLRSNIARQKEEIAEFEKSASSLSRQLASLKRQTEKNQEKAELEQLKDQERQSDLERRRALQKSRQQSQEKNKIENAHGRLGTAIEAFIIKEEAKIDSQTRTLQGKLNLLNSKEFVISRSHQEKVIIQQAGWFTSEKSELQTRTQTGRCEFQHIEPTDIVTPDVHQKLAAHAVRVRDVKSRLSDLSSRKAWLLSLARTPIERLSTDPKLSQSLNAQILRLRDLKAAAGANATKRSVSEVNQPITRSPNQVTLTNQREVLKREVRSIETKRKAIETKIATRVAKLTELQSEVEQLSALSGVQDSTQSKPPQRAITQWQDAEILAKDFLVWLGHHDAHLTGNGADGGTDVEGREFVAQVKMHNKPTGRPDVQQLFGIAAAEKKSPIFFAMAFTADAQEWASKVGMEMYRFTRSGQVKQVT